MLVWHRVHTDPGKPGKPGKKVFFGKTQGKPGKPREKVLKMIQLRENSGNFFFIFLEKGV